MHILFCLRVRQNQPWDHVHRHELLEEQLRRIRNRQLCHLLRALAIRAPAVVSHEPALLAGVHLELVRRDHQSFEQKLCRAITNETIALHLSETQATLARPTLRGLASTLR